jgi:RNA polymerase sigma factor (sigma-70 family)
MTPEELGFHWNKHTAELLAYAMGRLISYEVTCEDSEVLGDIVQDTLAGILGNERKCYEAWSVRPGIPITAPFKEAIDYRCREYRDAKKRHQRLTYNEWATGEVKWKPVQGKEEANPGQGKAEPDVRKEYPDHRVSPEDEDRKLDVGMAIGSLDPEDREIILMYFYECMTEQEIADKKGWTHRKVEMARKRAQRLLKGQLEAYRPQRTDQLRSQQAS